MKNKACRGEYPGGERLPGLLPWTGRFGRKAGVPRQHTMKTLEVAPNLWKRFFEHLNGLGPSANVTIQMSSNTSTPPTEIAAREPLQEILFDENPGQCSNLVRIRAGQSSGRPFEFTLVEPVRIFLKNGQNDRYNQIHILAESGTTILALNPGLPTDLLQSLAA